MIVEIDNVFKYYNKIPAINGVSLNIEKSERVVVLGPSGCGKTTLLRIIAGFIQPDEGKVTIDGLVVAMTGRCLVEPESRKIGMVFQDIALWPHMSVYGNLEFGLRAKNISREKRNRLIDEMLEKVQMTHFKDASPGDLSGGQQQRIALARALIMQPRILLMDEPLSNLDLDLNLLLRKEILRMQEDLGITMLYVTHDREEAFSLAMRVVLMGHGRIQKIGNADEVSKYLLDLSM
ncbi:MAG: ABC transporter ATP-binding protein [Nitrospinae bacterium]|nr:ABC transporter ATP-binding protein [Nitrospinota bacterium]